jgi:hypothetical protein
MRIDVGLPDFVAIMATADEGLARAATEAMRETTPLAKQELREQVTSNGLGQRLANTWQSEVYPNRPDRVSLTPTGVIESGASDIIDSYVRGATIRPTNGGKYLWIPTKYVPRARGRVSVRGKNIRGGAMTPSEVESMFSADFEIRPGRGGTLLAFIDVVKAKNMRGFRRDTAGRRKQGRAAAPVLMFVLRKTVKMPKLLDLNGPASRWADAFAAAFARRLAD